MDPREEIVGVLKNLPHYKIVGGYSILKSARQDIEVRETKDLDIRLCSNLHNTYNIDDLLHALKANKIPAKVEKTKNNQYKVYAQVDETVVKIDIEFKDGSDISGQVKSINESIRDKFYLSMVIDDRSFKNIVDVITCLRSDYPDGISKKDFLSLIDKDQLHYVKLEKLLELASKFKPESLDGISMQDHAVWFSSLVEGLISTKIKDEYIFKNGKWLY